MRERKTKKPGATPEPEAVRRPVRRLWLFRLLAVVVLPLLALGLAEAALRLGGYGYPTSFFLPKRINGQDTLVENARFGWRFFSPTQARSPSPVVIRAVKPVGAYRIFLFGESAAMGDPRPAFGVGRYLEVLLRERFPGVEFEVVCTAMTAINSHAILPIARECAHYQGDLWIVYTGNNEMDGPFGANTVFGLQSPPASVVRASLALQRARLGQWLAALARSWSHGSAAPATWGGLKMFLESQIPPDDPRKARAYENFRRNLEDIVRAGRHAGVPIILSSVASNLKDCAPFGSLHSPALGPAGLEDWDHRYQSAIESFAQGRWDEAAGSFREAARQSPRYAEAHFRLGESFLAMTNVEAARQSFVLARDLDALPFRADSPINTLIAQTARRHAGQGVSFLDAEKILATLSPNRILGNEFFLEHIHLNFAGNYALARAMAEQARTLLPIPIATSDAAAWATPEICAERLGLTDWNRLTVLEDIAKRLSDAPYTNQCNHAIRYQALLAQLVETKRRLQSESAAKARGTYEAAIQSRPEDRWLHFNYAEFLKETGDLPQATLQMRKVRDLAPQHYAAYLQLGRLLARQKQYGEARQFLEESLRLQPDLGEPYLELAQIDASEGKLDEALHQLDLARRCRPDDITVPLRQAEILAGQNKHAEAIRALREAIRLRPFYGDTHYRLGIELAVNDQNAEAQAEFESVLRQRPDFVPAHLNLGSMLARRNRFAEARAHFQEALRLEPRNEKAAELINQLDRLKSP